MDRKKIGNFIAQLRKERNWTQEQLAQELFVDRATISKWETGSYIANLEALIALSNLFKISVNELLAGERENKENREHINRVPIDILKESRRRLIRCTIISLIFILLLFFLFLIYYFVSTYNSIRVYKIGGESEHFSISDGLIVLSKKNAYINLGRIDAKNQMEIKTLKLYFINKSNQKVDLIINHDNKLDLIINQFDSSEYFFYSEIPSVLQNLFLEITYNENKREIMQVKTSKSFSNDYFIVQQKVEKVYLPEEENYSDSVPNAIKDNFKYNGKENIYHRESIKDNGKVKEEYVSNIPIYFVNEIKGENTDAFYYEINENWIGYSFYLGDRVQNEFEYDIKRRKCMHGTCKEEKIEYFIENYINKIDFEK